MVEEHRIPPETAPPGAGLSGDTRVQMNFGGFVSLSTIDWRGRAVCTVFFRGCPIHCSYCQNEGIISGEDYRDIGEVKEMIRTSAPFISGVVFSGGEPTMQKDALVELARYAKSLHLEVGIQTNGLFPDTLTRLLDEQLADRIALDFKSRFEGYSGSGSYEKNVRRSFKICKNAYAKNILREFEVVITIFYENAEYIQEISALIGRIPLVLQQGEHKIPQRAGFAPEMSEGEYREKKRMLQERYHPLSLEEIRQIADHLGRKVRIRTREIGEIEYTGERDEGR